MLVLPIVNRGKIVHVEMSLKDAKKVKEKTRIDGIEASDIIIVGKTNLKNSSYNEKKVSPDEITEYIRNNNRLAKNDFLVTTKEERDSDCYDIYQLEHPPEKVNRGLDSLYGSMILDMKNEVPNNDPKSRYIDFKKMGIIEGITPHKLDQLERIAHNLDHNFQKELKENDLTQLIDILNNLLEYFDGEIIDSSSIKLEDFFKVKRKLDVIHSRDARNLNHYYNIAQSNQQIYSIISKLYYIVYNEPLHWFHKRKDKAKEKIRKKEK